MLAESLVVVAIAVGVSILLMPYPICRRIETEGFHRPMPRFTILSMIQATIIVALSCTLARYVGYDLLTKLVIAGSSSGLGIGLWCYVAKPGDVPSR